jgi:hypothetical protein
MSAVESRAFFGLVAQLMNGESITNEAMVECISQRSGLFLCHVVFHSFADGADRQHKCACIFSDPLFYLPILECPSNVVALLEYVESENDCLIVLQVNRSARPPAAGRHRCRVVGGQESASRHRLRLRRRRRGLLHSTSSRR